jgi:bifunctional ADP-heptose synthase (sugar kinase/adenylyltransferase)
MAALMACGLSAREAMPWANKAGGIVVGKFGTAATSAAELFD